MPQYLTVPAVTQVAGNSKFYTLVDSDASYNDVISAGFLSAQQVLGHQFTASDIIYIVYSGGNGFFTCELDANSIITLSPASPDNQFKRARVALTAAEFNGMYAAPVLLVPAQGSNKLIIVNDMQVVLTYGSAAFASGGVVFAQYDSTASGGGVKATNTEAAADFFVTASTTFSFKGTSGNTVGALPVSTTSNKGLYLSNATGAFTTGNSTIEVDLHYQVITTTATLS